MSYEYEYARPSVSVDVVVFREFTSKHHVLLIQRKKEPFANCWALPGGFMNMNETVETAAKRELQEETGLVADRVEQLHAFSKVKRDPRGRVVSIAFYAEVPSNQQPIAADDAKKAKWFPLLELPDLAFDHDEMIQMAIARIDR